MNIDPPFVIKVCGVTREEDARLAVEAGANALGFNFYPESPRYLTPRQAQRIAASVTGDCLRVGVFVNAPEDELLSIADAVSLDVLQLHGERTALPTTCRYRIWKSVPGDSLAPPHDERIEAYLLDSRSRLYGGSGKTFDWTAATAFPYRAIVAGGLDGGNVAQAIATLRPWGVDACSLLELRPGAKDPARVQAFVQASLSASHTLATYLP